jgi:hypothetical protein
LLTTVNNGEKKREKMKNYLSIIKLLKYIYIYLISYYRSTLYQLKYQLHNLKFNVAKAVETWKHMILYNIIIGDFEAIVVTDQSRII